MPKAPVDVGSMPEPARACDRGSQRVFLKKNLPCHDSGLSLQLPGTFLSMPPTPEPRRSKRVPLKGRASLIVVNHKGRMERLPCIVLDRSQGGFRVRVSSKLRRGQVVEVSLDEDPGNSVRCSVVWTGKPGSKQEGEAGLQTV